MLGEGIVGAVQNFSPNPRRFFVPSGSCFSLQRLCMERFFG